MDDAPGSPSRGYLTEHISLMGIERVEVVVFVVVIVVVAAADNEGDFFPRKRA